MSDDKDDFGEDCDGRRDTEGDVDTIDDLEIHGRELHLHYHIMYDHIHALLFLTCHRPLAMHSFKYVTARILV
jgi:hypothetical protein